MSQSQAPSVFTKKTVRGSQKNSRQPKGNGAGNLFVEKTPHGVQKQEVRLWQDNDNLLNF